MSTLSLSHSGLYLAGGTADGRIFFWEISSGTLLLTIDAHYRSISVLEFSHDDAALITGAEDAGVSVWNVGRYVAHPPPHSRTNERKTEFSRATDCSTQRL
jgi:pre-rRNA-processing protein IPI3